MSPFPWHRRKKPAPSLLADVSAWIDAHFAPEEGAGEKDDTLRFQALRTADFEESGSYAAPSWDYSASMPEPAAVEPAAAPEPGPAAAAGPSAAPEPEPELTLGAMPAPSMPLEDASYSAMPAPSWEDEPWWSDSSHDETAGTSPNLASMPVPPPPPPMAQARTAPSYSGYAPMPAPAKAKARREKPAPVQGRRRKAAPARPTRMPSAAELFRNMDASFSETLFALVDARGLSDPEVYRAAGISRQHFSKIRSNPAYRPTKPTVLALAIALHLDLEETGLLLERAGFALSHASKTDLVVEYCILHDIYDIIEVDSILYACDLPTIGS